MTRSKSISVKIPTQRVILALETALAKLEADYSSQEANETKHEKAHEAWRKELGKWAIANFSRSENLRTSYRSYNNRLNVDFDIIVKESEFPTEPEKDFEVLHQHEYLSQKNEMANAIRILKMTDEETVSASTYNAIARYL